MKRKTIAASLAASLLLAACGASHHSAADHVASAPSGGTSTARSDSLGQPAHTRTTAQPPATQTPTVAHASATQTVASVQGTTATVTNAKSSATDTSTAVQVSATRTSTAAQSATHTSTAAPTPTTHTSTDATPSKTATATSTVVATTTTPEYTTVNSTTPVGSANADPPPSTGPAPVPTGADPTGDNSPTDCLTAAGLNDAHMWESGSWEAMDSTDHKPVYIDGPFASHQAAVTDGNSLTPVEYVVAAGDYVVQTVLTNPSPDVLTSVAKCLEG